MDNPAYDEQKSRAQIMKYYAHCLLMRPEITVFGLKDWIVREYLKSSTIVAEMKQPVDPSSLRHQIFDHLTQFVQTGTRVIMYLLVAFRPDYFEVQLAALLPRNIHPISIPKKLWLVETDCICVT